MAQLGMALGGGLALGRNGRQAGEAEKRFAKGRGEDVGGGVFWVCCCWCCCCCCCCCCCGCGCVRVRSFPKKSIN